MNSGPLIQNSSLVFVTAGYRITFKIWQGNAAGPIYALQMGYGLGSMGAIMLETLFVDPRFSGGVIETGYNSTCRINKSISNPSLSNHISADSDTKGLAYYPANFVNPYWMWSALSLTLSLVFAAYHIHKLRSSLIIGYNARPSLTYTNDHKTFRESISPKSCSPFHPTYAALIIMSLFFFYAASVPIVRAFAKFIFSYARDGPCLTVLDSTSLETAYFAALTIGRLCTFLLSMVLHMKVILQIEMFGLLTTVLLLYFLRDNIIILWIGSIALGLFTGPLSPTTFAWANRYVEVTSIAQIVPQIGGAIGDVAFLMGVGYSYQHYGPYVLWSYQLILAVELCVTSWLMQTLGSLHGDRYQE